MLPLSCHQNSQHSSRLCILWNPTAYHTGDGEQRVRGNINTKETGEEKPSTILQKVMIWSRELTNGHLSLISFSGLVTTKLVKGPYYWTWLSKQVVRDCLRKHKNLDWFWFARTVTAISEYVYIFLLKTWIINGDSWILSSPSVMNISYWSHWLFSQSFGGGRRRDPLCSSK